MATLYILFIVLFMMVSLLTCVIILLQESKSAGLGAAFGGESVSQILGSSSAAILKKITVGFAFSFFALSLILSVWTGSFTRVKYSQTPQALIQK